MNTCSGARVKSSFSNRVLLKKLQCKNPILPIFAVFNSDFVQQLLLLTVPIRLRVTNLTTPLIVLDEIKSSDCNKKYVSHDFYPC